MDYVLTILASFISSSHFLNTDLCLFLALQLKQEQLRFSVQAFLGDAICSVSSYFL